MREDLMETYVNGLKMTTSTVLIDAIVESLGRLAQVDQECNTGYKGLIENSGGVILL